MDETEKGIILGRMKEFMINTKEDITEIKDDYTEMKKDIKSLLKFKNKQLGILAFIVFAFEIVGQWLRSKGV